MYTLVLDELSSDLYFISIEKEKWIWNRWVGHISMKTIFKLSNLNLVKGFFQTSFDKGKIYEGYIKKNKWRVISIPKA